MRFTLYPFATYCWFAFNDGLNDHLLLTPIASYSMQMRTDIFEGMLNQLFCVHRQNLSAIDRLNSKYE